MSLRAVVFAYHNVGVACLQVLIRYGVDIVLVVTHEDNVHENIWFDSVSALCARLNIACIAPADPTAPDFLEQVKLAQPDILFSFYYRHMLPTALLGLAPYGAFNMHGSLLPKYRGRAPVNWAVLHGETVTGATLHEMVGKPDAGAIVAQSAVSIAPDDTAQDVFQKVVGAAERSLHDALPALLAGKITRQTNDLTQGSYFGGRTAADGQIDWAQPAQAVYNLIRAVAPPYPGAWTMVGDHRLVVAEARLLPSRLLPDSDLDADSGPDIDPEFSIGLNVAKDKILGTCGDGGTIDVRTLLYENHQVSVKGLQAILDTPQPICSKKNP